jgi:DNA-binding LacI/PurR family transcriptional regulator
VADSERAGRHEEAGARATAAPGRRRRSASMADVAQLAGVSAQTVSRVSNGSPGVVESTRQQVLAAMRELGYRPNSAARALKRGEFRTLGVILFNLSTTGNTRTLEAIAASAAHEGYAITLLPVAVPTQDGVRGAFTRMGELAVDGVVILMEAHLLDTSTVTLPPHAHVVVVDSNAGDRYRVVDSDQTGGARAVVQHLLDLGHDTVWHVAGPADSYSAQRRVDAWRAQLHDRRRTVPEPVRGDWTADSGYRAGLRLAREPDCTAVFVANDQMALGVLRALHEAGRRVPQDISVAGFDDIPEAASYLPPLTTVHQDFPEVGRRCVEQVLRQIRGTGGTGCTGGSGDGSDGSGSGDGGDGGGERGITLVPTRLVVRASTGPPPDLR